MKKILSIFLILALLFSLAACGSKKTADVEVIRNDTGSSEQNENAVIPLNLSTVDDFSNGFAWIFHKDINGAKTYSLIDTSGKIIYSNPNISYHGDMDTDACYIVEGDGDNRIYKIIDTNGNEVASSESGAFDSIEACGDNLFLVYKDKSDISSSRNALGIIDTKGNFVNELKESVFLNTDPSKTQTKYKHYLGSGMFAIAIKTYGANDYITYDYLIYSSQTKKTFYLNRINISNTQTSMKDTVYIYADNDSSIIYENSPDKSVSISDLSSKSLFSLSSNGVVQSANGFSSIINNTIIKNDYNNSKLTLTDPVTNKSSVFTKYPISEIASADDNFILTVKGKDQKTYFLLIDKNCNQLFEPVQADFAQASDGKIVLKKGDTFSVIDFAGNTLFETSEYIDIKGFHSGIAWAQKKSADGSKQYYGIDSSGNVVIS